MQLLDKLKNIKNKSSKKKKLGEFILVKWIVKFFSLIYSNMIKVSTKNIGIYDIVIDEDYIKEINIYKKFNAYYNKDYFCYTLTTKDIKGYSLSDIGNSFYKFKKRKALLIIAEEKKDEYEFYFINTGNPFGKDINKDVFYKNELGHLILKKDSFINLDKRLEFAFMYYSYIIEDKEIYIIANKKLEIFKDVEDKLNYLTKQEIYEIMFRTPILESNNTKLLRNILFISIIIFSTYYLFDYGSTFLQDKNNEYSIQERNLKAFLSENKEITKKKFEQKQQIENEIKNGKKMLILKGNEYDNQK